MRVFDSRKLLPVSVFLLISTLAVSGATSKETAVVKDLSFHPSGASLEVKIATTEQADYTYFELSKPRRLVVDFHGIQNRPGRPVLCYYGRIRSLSHYFSKCFLYASIILVIPMPAPNRGKNESDRNSSSSFSTRSFPCTPS